MWVDGAGAAQAPPLWPPWAMCTSRGVGLGKKARYLPCRYRSRLLGSRCHRCYSYKQMNSWGRRSLLHRELHRPLPGKRGKFWIRGCPMLGGCDRRILTLTQDVHVLESVCYLIGESDFADVIRALSWRILDYPGGPNVLTRCLGK